MPANAPNAPNAPNHLKITCFLLQSLSHWVIEICITAIPVGKNVAPSVAPVAAGWKGESWGPKRSGNGENDENDSQWPVDDMQCISALNSLNVHYVLRDVHAKLCQRVTWVTCKQLGYTKASTPFCGLVVAFGDAESFQQSSSSSASRNAQQELRTRHNPTDSRLVKSRQNTPLTMTHHYCFR